MSNLFLWSCEGWRKLGGVGGAAGAQQIIINGTDHVFLPVDFSDAAFLAATQAVALARRSHTRLGCCSFIAFKPTFHPGDEIDLISHAILQCEKEHKQRANMVVSSGEMKRIERRMTRLEKMLRGSGVSIWTW